MIKKYAAYVYSMDGEEDTYMVAVDLPTIVEQADYITEVVCGVACGFELINKEGNLNATMTVVRMTRELKQLTLYNEESLRVMSANAVRVY